MRWERVKLKVEGGGRGRRGGTAGPGKRWGHTCNSLKQGRYLYVFGGYGKDNRQTNDVHVFDTAKQTWSKPMVKGTPPSPRDSHTCTTVGTSLFVFGGTDGKSLLQDLYILDTGTNTWAKPKVSGESPAPREGHTAALIGTNIFVFGGCGKTLDEAEEVYFNDLYILDTVRLHWTKALTEGIPPVPRDSHTCSAYENKLIVMGGEDASDSYLADVQMLDTDMMEWREFQTTGQILTPRAGHATVSIGKLIFVFGGFTDDRKLFDDLHMLDLDTGVWSKMVADGVGPSPRFSVAGDSITGGVLVFIGGCNDNLEALDDMYYLDTEIQSEKAQDEKPERFSLRKELKRKRQENQLSMKSPHSEKEVLLASAAALKPPMFPVTVPPPAVPVSHAAINSSLYDFKPAEERIFEAKITDVFHYGYTIESVVDGRLLRGLLFCYKPGFAHAVHAYLTKKKLSSTRDTGNAKDMRSSISDTAHIQESGMSTAGASVQNVSGRDVHNVSGQDSLEMQPTYISDECQHYLQPQRQAEVQHQPLQQQPHYQYQHQEPHSHCPLPQYQDHIVGSLYSHQQVHISTCAPTQLDSLHVTESRHDETVQALDREVEPSVAFTVEGVLSSSQGFMQVSDDSPSHQASGQNACEFTIENHPPPLPVTSLPTRSESLPHPPEEGHGS